MLENNLLIHELQLGVQLNECVHSERFSDFALMLAMLVDDVREHSQFMVPKSAQVESITTESMLRKRFHLSEPSPLAIVTSDEITGFAQAEYISENRLADLQLQNVLTPKPLAFRDNANFINSQILANTSAYCQQKYRENNAEKSANKRLQFNANGWLQNIQQTLVAASLTGVHSIA